jgi:hypothetical protein
LKTLRVSCVALLLGSVIHRYVVCVLLTVCAKKEKKEKKKQGTRENSKVALALVEETSKSDEI